MENKITTIKIAPLKYVDGYTLIDCRLFIHTEIDVGRLSLAFDKIYGNGIDYLTGVNQQGFYYVKKIITFDELQYVVNYSLKL